MCLLIWKKEHYLLSFLSNIQFFVHCCHFYSVGINIQCTLLSGLRNRWHIFISCSLQSRLASIFDLGLCGKNEKREKKTTTTTTTHAHKLCIVFDVSCFSFLCHKWIKVINHFSAASRKPVWLSKCSRPRPPEGRSCERTKHKNKL